MTAPTRMAIRSITVEYNTPPIEHWCRSWLGENFILGAVERQYDLAVVNDDVTLRNVLSIGKDRNILGYPQVLETDG